MEECDEDLQNIIIPESYGLHKVVGLDAKIPDISWLIKKKLVNIGSEAEPKFVHIGNYWDEDAVGKVSELLHEYHDLFPTDFFELKGIVGDLGMMKINLNPYVKSVK